MLFGMATEGVGESGTEHAARVPPRRPSRKAIVEGIALVLVLVVIGGLLWFRLRPEPYGAGSTHRYTLEKTSVCMDPDPVGLDGRQWRATGPGSRSSWTDWQFPLSGTFHIKSGGKAEFVPDAGGLIPFEGGRQFVDLSCQIQ